MVNVVRVRVGEEVVLFDGSGREARARLVGAKRREAALEILSVEEVDREPARRLTIACALPRASRMDFLVEKCCELGVARLMPMVTQRSVVDPIKRDEKHLRRWRRIAIEAAKQSGRTRLTEIGPVITFNDALSVHDSGDLRLIAWLEGDATDIAEQIKGLRRNKSVFLLIGPEGGFTPEEVESAVAAGCSVVSLGERILHVETAAISLAALLLLGGMTTPLNRKSSSHILKEDAE